MPLEHRVTPVGEELRPEIPSEDIARPWPAMGHHHCSVGLFPIRRTSQIGGISRLSRASKVTNSTSASLSGSKNGELLPSGRSCRPCTSRCPRRGSRRRTCASLRHAANSRPCCAERLVSFRLARRPGRVQDEQRIFRCHDRRLEFRWLRVHQFVVPDIAALVPRHVAAGAWHGEHVRAVCHCNVAFCFSGTARPPRKPSSAVISVRQSESRMRSLRAPPQMIATWSARSGKCLSMQL